MKRILAALVATAFAGAASAQTIFPNPTGGGGGGSGTVTSIATACGVTGGSITTTGTIQGSITANAQTGTSYTPLATDCGKLVTISNASAIAITLTNANFSAGNFFEARVLPASVGAATFTPSSGTIDAAATLVLQPGQGTVLIFDGTNWQTMGQYTTGPASSTAGNFPSFTGTGGQRLQDSGKAAPTGAVVGTTDSQTLTNKSIAASQINSGTVAIANGGTGTASPATVAGNNISVTGSFPNQTITSALLPAGGYRSGVWSAPFMMFDSALVVSNAPALTTAYCAPGIITGSDNITLASLGMRTTTGGTNATLAIYNNVTAASTPNRPGTLVRATTSTSVAAATSIEFALTSTVSVAPGLYWFCMETNDTALRYASKGAGGSDPYGVIFFVGSVTLNEILTGVTSGTAGVQTTTGISAYNTWPDFTSATWSQSGGSTIPAIAFKVQ